MVDFQDSIIGNIYGSIASAESFDIDQKSWKMAMSYKHTDGHFAKLIAVEQIKSLCNFYITRKKSKGLETAEFLQRKKDSLQQAIRGRESAFAAWKDSNQKLIKAAGETEEAKFKQDLTLMNSVYSETNRQLETARLALLDESPIVQIIDTPKYPLPKTVSSNIKLLIIAVSILGILLISGILIAQKVLGEFIRKEKEKKLKNELRG